MLIVKMTYFQVFYSSKMDSGQLYYKHQGTVLNVIVKIMSGSVYDTLLKPFQQDGILKNSVISTKGQFPMLIVEILSGKCL